MRKLKLFSLLLMLLVGIGQVWAGEVTVKSTFTKATVPSGDQVTDLEDEVTWNIATTVGKGSPIYEVGKSTVECLKFGNSSSVYFSKIEFSTDYFKDVNVKSVTMYVKNNGSKVGTLTATQGSITLGTASHSAATSAWGTLTTEETNKGAGGTLTVTYEVAQASYISYIEVTYETSGEDPYPVAVTGVSLNKASTSIVEGKTETLTAIVAPSNASDKSVSWSSDDESVATVDGGVVTAVAVGTATITVTTTDGSFTDECEVTVTEAPAAVNYMLVTNVSDLAADAEIIIVNIDEDKAISTTQASSNRTATTVSSTSHVIAAGDDVQVITLEASGDNWKFNVGDSKYLYAASNSSNHLKTAAASTAGDNGVWAITIASDGAATVRAQGSNSRKELHYNPNNNSPIFSCYAEEATTGTLIKIFKKLEGAPKADAGLAYAAADQKKLVKVGEAFTAPTLTNPNSLTVSYASDNTEVAEVANDGSVTIKAAGKAVITASSVEDETYYAGSASYTIGVTTHAGTEADPYDAEDAKIAIDAKGTVENAYATGVVSNVVTTELPSEGYITFYFSADGLTSGQQIEAFKCYGLNSAPFEAVTDVKTGATVVITGTLKKYNSTYEFDANCHLVSYEAPATPKQSIANDQAHPYTVAQAITFAADGVTYDLNDYVYVQGVVYDVKSFNSTNGTLDIYIKDANAENQFELFKCAGINDGSATTPFYELSDVQAGNIVIGYGQLSYYAPYYEFKQGNYLVDLQTPATGVELDKTEASVEEEATVTLTATILPSNATGTIVWSVESGSDKASVENGVVTGIAEGEATIRATVQGTAFYAECTVTVTAAAAPLTDYYEKVTETAGIVEGTYLIVYEDGENSLAFNGGLETLDAENNTIDVEITNDNKIGVTQATAAATFYIDPTAGSIQAANGKYIGVGGNSNGLKTSDNADTYTHNFSIDGDGNAVIAPNFEGSTMSLRYNAASNQARFRYYKENGQQAIQLYKLANEVIKPAAGLAWDPAEDIEITVGEAFTPRTLQNPNGIDAAEITIESSNTDVATVTDGVVALVAEATGTTTITATFAGNASYKPATVSYKIKVNPAHSIYVNKLNVNFGSVVKDAEVDDQTITVTLTGVDAATAVLAGDGASAFEYTPAALTASGDITISASSATAGTFAATLTISDDAGEAESKVVYLSLTVTEPEIIDDLTGTWVLATAVPEIGEKFIVAGTYNSVTKTMGKQNTNPNRAAVESSLSEGVLTPGEGTKVFTLVNAGDGKFAIKASNNKYLTASGTGTNNHLTEAADYEVDNAKWTILISEGIASVVASSNNRNNLQYNKSGDGLFSCYSGNQTAIQLFVLQGETPEPEPVYETVRGGLTAGNYYTVCWPKAMTAIKGGSLWSFAGKDASTAYLIQEDAPFEAGKPYIIYATADKLEAVVEGEDADAGSNNGLYGTLSYMDADDLSTAGATHMLKDNAIRPIGTNNHLDAQRAYIILNDIQGGAPVQAPGKRVRAIPMHQDQATGVDELNAAEAPVKMIIDGQLFILRGEKMYDATGRLVK